MYRVSIPYPTQSDGQFDWDYYMTRHLPLAVGTSMRHSGINFCDADQPLTQNDPFTCVCMVHFDSEKSMSGFCNFFAEGHADADTISADEHNYTNIPPDFVTSEFSRLLDNSDEQQTRFRLKLFFPHMDGLVNEQSEIRSRLDAFLKSNGSETVLSEVDFCLGGVMPGSNPSYSLIWANSFSENNSMELFYQKLQASECLQFLQEKQKVTAKIMLSNVLPFDLSLTSAYHD